MTTLKVLNMESECSSLYDEVCVLGEGDPLKCIESLLCRQDRGAAYFISPAATPRQLLLCLAFLLSERTIESNIDKTILATPLADEIPSFLFKVSCNLLYVV